jgi:hypothetical protein
MEYILQPYSSRRPALVERMRLDGVDAAELVHCAKVAGGMFRILAAFIALAGLLVATAGSVGRMTAPL